MRPDLRFEVIRDIAIGEELFFSSRQGGTLLLATLVPSPSSCPQQWQRGAAAVTPSWAFEAQG